VSPLYLLASSPHRRVSLDRLREAGDEDRLCWEVSATRQCHHHSPPIYCGLVLTILEAFCNDLEGGENLDHRSNVSQIEGDTFDSITLTTSTLCDVELLCDGERIGRHVVSLTLQMDPVVDTRSHVTEPRGTSQRSVAASRNSMMISNSGAAPFRIDSLSRLTALTEVGGVLLPPPLDIV
jgi:hypothetical protein